MPDLDAVSVGSARHMASSNRRSKSAARAPAAGWSGGRCRPSAMSTRRGICSRLTPAAASDGAMPIVCLSWRSQAQEARRRRRRRRPRAPAPRTCAAPTRTFQAQHRVDHQRVGQAVVQVADGAERVRARVHRAEVLLEGDRAHHRAHHHVGAGRGCAGSRTAVTSARAAMRVPFERDAVAQRVVGRRQVALDVVRQRVHAGRRGDRRAAGRASAPGRRRPTRARIFGEKTTRLTCVSSSR